MRLLYGWPYSPLAAAAISDRPLRGLGAEDRRARHEQGRARLGARAGGRARRCRRRPRAPGRSPTSARRRSILSSEPGRNAWPPQPGLTVMHSTRSSSPTSSRDRLDRRARVDREPGAAARVADGGERVVDVRRRLDVERDAVGAGLGEVRDLALGPLDHQVDVEEAAGVVDLARPAPRRRSAPCVIGGTKWPSMTSTWIDARAGVEHRADLLAEPGEVGREDRWGDARGRARHQIGWSIELRQWLQRRARCSTCARSSSARRSWGRPRQLEAVQAVHAAVAAGQVGRAQPRLVAGRADVAQVDRVVVAHAPPSRRRRAMKKPSVPSRCGRVCAKPGTRGCSHSGASARRSSAAEVGALGQERRDHALVLGGRDRARGVDERAARAQRGRAGAQDRGLLAREPRRQVRRLAPARVGARGERAEVRARRVDEHAVVRGRLVAARRRRRCATSTRGAHARRGAAQRGRAAGVALDRDQLAAIPHQRREVRRLAARARRTGRARARPAAAPSSRATAIAARDWGMKQPRCPLGRREGVERAVEHEPLGQARRRVGRDRQPRAPARRGVGRAACWRAAPPRRARCRPPSARARPSAPSASHHSRAIHSGCEWRSAARAGVASSSAATRAAASRAPRRSTALTSFAPPGDPRLTSSTDSATAACAGTRSR